MTQQQYGSSNLVFARGTVPSSGQTTIGGVLVTLTSMNAETTPSVYSNISIRAPRTQSTHATIEFRFSRVIHEFRLELAWVRSDEITSGFNIGAPHEVTGTLVNRNGKITTSLPYPSDSGAGWLIWRGINTDRVSFVVDASGNGATSFNSFAISTRQNFAPVALIDGPKDVKVGQTVNLDGSRSSDQNQDHLTYQWRMVVQPPGSNVILPSSSSSPYASFTPWVGGSYVIELTVFDGELTSAPYQVGYNAIANRAPSASLAAGTTMFVNQRITPSASVSDPDGNTLSYAWTLTKPDGSMSTLDNPSAPMPSFTPDVPGTYTLRLVVSDGQLSSSPVMASWLVQALPNKSPIAHAGADKSVETGELVQIDGSGSNDPDGDALVYQWSIVEKPAGSHVDLTHVSSAKPAFTPDLDGKYVIELRVSDNKANSEPVRVTYTATTPNHKPSASAGPGGSGLVGVAVALSGVSSSDADGDKLGYTWTLTGPKGSKATLDDPSSATPTFTPDVEGAYVVELVVSDGKASSTPSKAVYTVALPPPSVPKGLALTVNREGGPSEESIIVVNDGTEPAHMKGVTIEIPTAPGQAKQRTYTFQDDLVLAPGEKVEVEVHPASGGRTFGSETELMPDDALCTVELRFDGKVLVSWTGDPLPAKPAKPVTGPEVFSKFELDFRRKGSITKELVMLTNGTAEPVELKGLVVRVPTAMKVVKDQSKHVFTFTTSMILQPKQTLAITAGAGEYGFGSSLPLFYSIDGINYVDTVELVFEDKVVKSLSKSTQDSSDS